MGMAWLVGACNHIKILVPAPFHIKQDLALKAYHRTANFLVNEFEISNIIITNNPPLSQ